MSLKIVAMPNALSTERVELELEAGQTFREVVEAALEHPARDTAAVLLLDEPIPQERWEEAPPDGSTVIIRAIPAGSPGEVQEGAKKGMGWSMLTALVGFVMFLIPGLQGVAGYVFGLGIAGMLAGAGVYFGSKELEKMMGKATGVDSTNLPGLAGSRNQLSPWAPVPAILGKSRLTPYYAARPFTSLGGTDGEFQYMTFLFCLGLGPLKVSDLKIGESLLATNSADTRSGAITEDGVFSDVQIEIRQDGSSISFFDKFVNEEQLQIRIAHTSFNTLDNIRMTPPRTTGIEVDVTFPRGLFAIDGDGNTVNKTVTLWAEYKLLSQTWAQATKLQFNGSDNFTRARTKTIRLSAAATVASGQYEVRVRRSSGDPADSKDVSEFYWTALRSKRADDVVSASARSKVVLVGLKIKASDQLSGIIDQFNLIAQAILPAYTGSGSGSASWPLGQPTNPAAALLAVLRGPLNPRPAPDSMIDWPAFEAYFNFCANKGYECCSVVSQAGELRGLVDYITMASRASLSLRDGLYSVIIDNERSAPVQVFTPRNSSNFSGTRSFAELVHAIKISFVNASAGYKTDEVVVLDDGYQYDGKDAHGNAVSPPGSGGPPYATQFQKVDLWGVTTASHAWKIGRYLIAGQKLRRETFSLTVDPEHLVCTRGDMVLVNHDVPMFGLSYGRLEAVDAPGASIVSVTTDEICTFELGKEYMVRVRKADGSFVAASLVNPGPGDYHNLVFSSFVPAAQAPAPGDLFIFGESANDSVQMIILGMELNDDLSARLLLSEYAPAVFSADQGVIPDYDPKVSIPPSFYADKVISLVARSDSAWEGPPGPAGETGPQGPLAPTVPPSANPTNVVGSHDLNPNGTFTFRVAFDYTQGTNKANAVIVYWGSSVLTAPSVDSLSSPSVVKALGSDGHYVVEAPPLPCRTGGDAGLPIRYRFCVVAASLSGQTAQLCSDGLLDVASYTDKTFGSLIQAGGSPDRYWDMSNGELHNDGKVLLGQFDGSHNLIKGLKYDPTTGVFQILGTNMIMSDSDFITAEGNGRLSHEGMSLVWRDSVGAELARQIWDSSLDAIRITKFKVPLQRRGQWNGSGTWDGGTARLEAGASFMSQHQLPDGRRRIVYTLLQDLKEVMVSAAGVWGSPVVRYTNPYTPSAYNYLTVCGMADGRALLVYGCNVGGSLHTLQRIIASDGSWGAPVDLWNAGIMQAKWPTASQLMDDGRIRVCGFQNPVWEIIYTPNAGDGTWGALVSHEATIGNYHGCIQGLGGLAARIVHTGATPGSIVETMVDSSGVWGTPVVKYTDSYGNYSPCLEALPDGTTRCVWVHSQTGAYGLWQAIISSAGVWSAPTTIASLSASYYWGTFCILNAQGASNLLVSGLGTEWVKLDSYAIIPYDDTYAQAGVGIFKVGSNSNGYFVYYDDGTLEVYGWGYITWVSGQASIAKSISLPASFLSVTSYFAQATCAGSNAANPADQSAVTAASVCNMNIKNVSANSVTVTGVFATAPANTLRQIYIFSAWGRWK